MNKTIVYAILLLLSIPSLLAQSFDCASLTNGTFSVCDQFTDADFTTNPTWAGDATQFVVNASSQLQSNGTGTDTAYLSTPATLGSEWRFYFKMAFAPSDNNKMRVYLASDQNNLTAPLNGYFLEMGENGNLDAIKLYRQDGATLALLATGTAGIVATNPEMTIKVNRSAAGLWQVYTGSILGTDYNLDLTTTDNTYTASANMGIWCKYTSSNANKFSFDNFYVGNAIVDNTPPQVNSLEVLDANTLQICFSEIISAVESENPTNYTLNGSIVPITVNINANETCVTAVFTTPFAQGNNTLQIVGVQDPTGNTMLPYTGNFTLYAPALGDIVINEILADPDPVVGLPNYEFIELYNTRNFPITLNDWHISNSYPDLDGTINNATIPANGYLVLCATGAALTAYQGIAGINVTGVTSFPSILNTSGTFTLIDPNGTVINATTYDISWYNDAIKDDGGWTLERIDPTVSCGGAANWAASANAAGGTPGTQNSVFGIINDNTPPALIATNIVNTNIVELTFSEDVTASIANNAANYTLSNGIVVLSAVAQSNVVVLTLNANLVQGTTYTLTIVQQTDCLGNAAPNLTTQIAIPLPAAPGDVVINEILADPDPVVALPNYEFVELYNTRNFPISIAGWHLSDDYPDLGATIGSAILPANGYVVLCSSTALPAFQAIPDIMVISVSSFPSLTNSGKTLTLTNQDGIPINQVSYSIAWYNDPTKDDGGWTLERINPTIPCQGASNWAESTNQAGGTPGAQNSVYMQPTDVTPPVLLNANLVSTDSITLQFSEDLNAQSTTLSNFSINNGITINSLTDLGNGVLLLVLNNNLVQGTIYTINVAVAQDCLGNAASNLSTQVAVPQPADVFDVLMTEVFADPDPPTQYDLPNLALVREKFVELYNRSNKVISLKDWQLRDATDTTYLPAFILFPEQYIILCSSTSVAAFAADGINALGVTSFPEPNTTSDNLTLTDANSQTIHQVNYTTEWYRDAIKAQGGWTLEMIDTNNPCTGAENWRASVATIGGTPNAQNSVKANNPDQTIPDLVHVEVINPTTIQAFFSEPLSRTTSISNFTINNGIAQPTNANVLAPNFTSVVLSLSSPLQEGTLYELSVNTQTDCVGNAVGLHNTANFGIATTSDLNDLVINEILFNPSTGGYDFVELYNNSTKVLDLGRWFFANADVTVDADSLQNLSPIVSERYSILPGQYLAFTPNPAFVRAYYGQCNTDIPFNGIIKCTLPSYLDDEGVVALTDLFGGTVLDKVHYYKEWHNPLLNDENGVSLERVSPDAPSDNKNNWHSAAATNCYGTPGQRNSQFYEGQPLTDEISIEPAAFSPDGTGSAYFTEIRYSFDQPGYQVTINIYDERGRAVKQLVSNETTTDTGFFIWDGTLDNDRKAPIGIYVVLVDIFDTSGKTKSYKKTVTVTGKLN